MAAILRAGVAGLAAVVLMTTAGYGTAMAADSGGGSTKGDGTSTGSFTFQASNDSADPFAAKGYFHGESPFGPAFTLEGPIVCLQVEGNRAGFIYHTDDASNPLFKSQEVRVSVEDNASNGKDKIGFGFAQPIGTNHDCAPGETPDEVKSGDVSVDDD